MAPRDLLSQLIREYALCGVKQWETADLGLRRRASTCLQNKVVESEDDFNYEIYKPSHEKLFPMPTGSYQKDLNYCFFEPKTGNRFSYAFF